MRDRTASTGARRCALGVAIAGVLGAGCAAPGPLLQPGPDAPTWPPPPDEARIRYLGEFSTEADLKPGRGPFEGLGEFIFGKDAPRTLQAPMAVCTDGAHRLFVADSTAHVVHVFDLETRRYSQWMPPTDRPPFVLPVALVYDPAGRLLVADAAAAVICVFDAQGAWLGEIGRGKVVRPCGLALDAARGRLFIADTGAHRVVVLDGQGRETARIGRRGAGPGEFNYPTHMGVDSRGRLFVSDTLNFRVQVFDAEFRPEMVIGRKGDMPGYFSQPKGVSLDARDRLFVVDANFEAVQVFDSNGDLLMTFGREGRGPGEFWLPAGIFVDGAGRLWVADSFNRRVQVFEELPAGSAQ